MKLSRTILPALAMLIVAAVMLTTASFAWFAMSTEVAATNMSVGIKSDSSYLLISEDGALDTIRTNGKTSLEYASVAKTNLLPVALDSTKIATGVSPIEELSTYDGVWYYQTAENPGSSAAAADAAKTSVTSADVTDYLYKKTFYLAVAAGSNAMTDLKARVSILNDAASGDEAIRVVVASENAYQVFNTTTENYVGATVLGDIAADGVVQIDVYIFYDGTDETVFTNNITSIIDSQISVYFTASVS